MPALALCFLYGLLALEAGDALVLFAPGLHAYLIAFVAGMLAAEPKLRPALEAAPSGAWWAALGGLLLCRAFVPHDQVTGLVAMVLAAALLVSGLLHGQRGSLHRALERPAVQALGRVSFSLYLLTCPCSTRSGAGPTASPGSPGTRWRRGWRSRSSPSPITYPLAWVSERWVERPAVIAGRRVADLIRTGRPKEGLRRRPSAA